MLTPQSRIPYLPARIEGLSTLAMNLWWSWSREARALFQSIDVALWHRTRHNPLELLCRVEPARLAACASDSDFLLRYDAVMQRMEHEADHSDTWFPGTIPTSMAAPWPTSAPSSASTTRCRSTRVVSVCLPATTANPPVTWVFRWSA